jgi:hypothetical protein
MAILIGRLPLVDRNCGILIELPYSNVVTESKQCGLHLQNETLLSALSTLAG